MKRYRITPTEKNCSVRSESSYFDDVLYGIAETFSEIEIMAYLSDDAVETLRSHDKVVDIEGMIEDLSYAFGSVCWSSPVYTMGKVQREVFYRDGAVIEHHNRSLLKGQDYIRSVSFHCPVKVEEQV